MAAFGARSDHSGSTAFGAKQTSCVKMTGRQLAPNCGRSRVMSVCHDGWRNQDNWNGCWWGVDPALRADGAYKFATHWVCGNWLHRRLHYRASACGGYSVLDRVPQRFQGQKARTSCPNSVPYGSSILLACRSGCERRLTCSANDRFSPFCDAFWPPSSCGPVRRGHPG